MINTKFVVVGATGLVGRQMLTILLERGAAFKNIIALASARSAGTELIINGETFKVRSLETFKDFSSVNIALFAAGTEIARKYAPIFANAGCYVIDNSSCFRMNEDIPLIVPEINMSYFDSKIIANPNCSTIQLVMALKPLHDLAKIDEIIVATYQSVSGAGKKGIDELNEQIKNNTKSSHFSRQIAFNVIPQIDVITNSGYTREELKMINETKKILNDYNLKLDATCVRVPVLTGHAVAASIKFQTDVDLNACVDALRNFEGIEVPDDFGTPTDCEHNDNVIVSRIRRHNDDPRGLSLWIVANNVRKGAALNAVQIAERLTN